MKTQAVSTLLAVALVAFTVSTGSSQGPAPATHTVFVSLIEVKGGTTADKLSPPAVNPKDLSKGYELKGPGADKNAPRRWEVSTYMFVPGHVTVRQGDTVVVTAFVVNGDEHEVSVNAPDGTPVVPKAKWNRGREYQISFVAAKPGAYQLLCSTHAPSMAAMFLALPR